MKAVLGFDTSCYTTSVALASEGALVGQRRQLLTVEHGKRGLMQSEGVFQHVTRLPALTEALMEAHPSLEIAAVCASTRPRPVEGSYMPVFTVGEGTARSVAAALGVPFFASTHQQGHVRAAMVDSGLGAGEPFLAVHLSGGTTEVIRVHDRLEVEMIGGSADLHAGQFVDRVGVALGLGFPAGPQLEELARSGTASGALPAIVKGLSCSFSGAESAAQRLIAAGQISRKDMAAEVYGCIARSIAKLLAAATEQTGIGRVLLAGGVASSMLLREILPARLRRAGCQASLFWGRPELSGDNAAGTALIGWELLEEQKR